MAASPPRSSAAAAPSIGRSASAAQSTARTSAPSAAAAISGAPASCTIARLKRTPGAAASARKRGSEMRPGQPDRSPDRHRVLAREIGGPADQLGAFGQRHAPAELLQERQRDRPDDPVAEEPAVGAEDHPQAGLHRRRVGPARRHRLDGARHAQGGAVVGGPRRRRGSERHRQHRPEADHGVRPSLRASLAIPPSRSAWPTCSRPRRSAVTAAWRTDVDDRAAGKLVLARRGRRSDVLRQRHARRARRRHSRARCAGIGAGEARPSTGSAARTRRRCCRAGWWRGSTMPSGSPRSAAADRRPPGWRSGRATSWCSVRLPNSASASSKNRIQSRLRRAVEDAGEVLLGLADVLRDHHRQVDAIDVEPGLLPDQRGGAQTVEKMMGIDVPERAKIIRIILLELSRIASHLLWCGTSALELNMSSVFMYCFGKREKILDLFEEMSGARMFPSCWRIGDWPMILIQNFESNLREFLSEFPCHLERS